VRGADAIKERIDAIVVGGSAGAVEALAILLPALPRHLQAAVFIVLHLPREHPSLLVEIFRSKCSLPVKEAEDKEPVQAGTVYFAPPDYHLLLDRGPQLSLSVDEPVHFSRPSVDVLFESAADLYGARLMGIILSGANADGGTSHGIISARAKPGRFRTVARANSSAFAHSALKRSCCPPYRREKQVPIC